MTRANSVAPLVHAKWLVISSECSNGWVLTIELDILPDHRALCFVLLIQWHPDVAAFDRPSANISNKAIKTVLVQLEPVFEYGSLNFSYCLGHSRGDAHAHQLFEAADVGDEIGVEIVAA